MLIEKLSLNDHTATLHLFKMEIDSCYERFKEVVNEVISISEQEKANRFFNVQDKKRYLVTRFALRRILSLFIDIPAGQIMFYQSGNRKPAVHGIEFNLTHSSNLLLIAISLHPVGVDIEFVQPDFTFEGIFSSICSSDEQFQILHADNPVRSFYTCWTRKEAVLKASGEGLVDDMAKLDIAKDTVLHNGIPYLVRTFPLIDDQYILSLASECNVNDVLFWNF